MEPRRQQPLGGIYLIECELASKAYIGQASNSIADRLNSHLGCLRRGKHSNKGLQSDWDRYGLDGFRFYVLEFFPRERRSNYDSGIREAHWIAELQGIVSLYNDPRKWLRCPLCYHCFDIKDVVSHMTHGAFHMRKKRRGKPF